ncbi:ubiquitin-like modifier-activating enzyme ATG7 [Panonychus citri]|uniref:ubiquitin-like modifier-activating enzyme ATG7 n=1 Tax=Panonychus citri TaxID=50023 RepID=UPI002307DEED|nr:ubiquitin-like modifier-activating enzyme ATG7 [Panonychus citri]
MESTSIKYFPFSSLIETSFWHSLSQNKLNIYKLDETEIPIQASYRNDSSRGLYPIVSLDYESFNVKDSWTDCNSFPLYGSLIIANTIEDFKSLDKTQLTEKIGGQIWNNIINSESSDNLPSILSRFLLIVYADLKKYRYYYWFCFPALCFPKETINCSQGRFLSDLHSESVVSSLVSTHKELPINDRSYFLTLISGDNQVKLFPLKEYSNLLKSSQKFYVSFADPCTDPNHPGWPLRNLITYLVKRFEIQSLDVLCYRFKNNSAGSSLIIHLTFDQVNRNITEYPGAIGWEKNEKSKLLPKITDLSATLDPKVLAGNSVDLNLRLMRWRLMPELNLEKIAATKCLLLGAGTLGSNVARGLLAWGVHQITFVDSGKVSYSNPVRQSLFQFVDCLNSGRPKAEAAAENLSKVYPNVISKGYSFTIPMPGHASFVEDIEETSKTVSQLEELIKEHDCVFLLMDSRESRWLPTVLGQIHGKLVINAALGFDTYLVQRHGVPPLNNSLSSPSSSESSSSANESNRKLGCYFCNDVVAPGDSSRNRTLDQQCTVTRPGVSMIASSLAVELMVSVLQHPLGYYAPANHDQPGSQSSECILGIIPHQIRGFLSQFTQFMPTSNSFDMCTACSPIVLESYKNHGFQFLAQVFKDCNYLEDLTGLKKLHDETNLDDVMALSDNESI